MRSFHWIRAFQDLRRRFRTDRRGASAVEFALVAGPLIFMIMCCIELALVILLSVTLDSATDIAARQIRTGITTSSNSTSDAFRQLVCNNMTWLAGSCMASLHVDVRTYTNFSLVNTSSVIQNGKIQANVFAYQIGGGSTIQVVRSYYEWPLFTPFLKPGLASLANGDAVITATAVFRNEPF